MRETTFPYFTKVPKITNAAIKIDYSQVLNKRAGWNKQVR